MKSIIQIHQVTANFINEAQSRFLGFDISRDTYYGICDQMRLENNRYYRGLLTAQELKYRLGVILENKDFEDHSDHYQRNK